jgi:hypothetical protein
MNFIQDCRISETSSDLEDVRNQFMYFVIGKSIGKIQNRLLKRPFFANKFIKILRFPTEDLQWITPCKLPPRASDARFLDILRYYSKPDIGRVHCSLVPNLLNLDLDQEKAIYTPKTYREFHVIFRWTFFQYIEAVNALKKLKEGEAPSPETLMSHIKDVYIYMNILSPMIKSAAMENYLAAVVERMTRITPLMADDVVAVTTKQEDIDTGVGQDAEDDDENKDYAEDQDEAEDQDDTDDEDETESQEESDEGQEDTDIFDIDPAVPSGMRFPACEPYRRWLRLQIVFLEAVTDITKWARATKNRVPEITMKVLSFPIQRRDRIRWEPLVDEVINRVGFCGLRNPHDYQDTKSDEPTLARAAIVGLRLEVENKTENKTKPKTKSLAKLLNGHPDGNGRMHCEALLATLVSCQDLEGLHNERSRAELDIQVSKFLFSPLIYAF